MRGAALHTRAAGRPTKPSCMCIPDSRPCRRRGADLRTVETSLPPCTLPEHCSLDQSMPCVTREPPVICDDYTSDRQTTGTVAAGGSATNSRVTSTANTHGTCYVAGGRAP